MTRVLELKSLRQLDKNKNLVQKILKFNYFNK